MCSSLARSFGLSVALAVTLGCAASSGREPSGGGGGLRLAHEIEFHAATPSDALQLSPTRGGIELEDAERNRVVLLRLADGAARAIEISSATGRRLGSVRPLKGAKRGLGIVDEEGTLLYTLRAEPDGDLRLLRGTILLYELKLRDYGYKIIAGDGRVEGRLRVKGGKTSLRDADGKTILSTRDAIPAAAAACLGLWEFPLEYGAGLSVAIVHWGFPPKIDQKL